MESQGVYRLRPAGRHILTIGRDLIQDQYAAIVELVKNAYDADASKVDIVIERSQGDGVRITVSDDGHGMTRDTVINKWLVPSTDDKAVRRTSPNKRVMQGRKGVGRYAVSMLGNDLFLETTDADGNTTEVFLDWNNFEAAAFLHDVEILVETSSKSNKCGTTLVMSGDKEFAAYWESKHVDLLVDELGKILSPVDRAVGTAEGMFSIVLTAHGIDDVSYDGHEIEPQPIFELFDYQIVGTIDVDGHARLQYRNNVVKNAGTEEINVFWGETGCGLLKIDLRVYDRDKDGIDRLLQRGLVKPDGQYYKKMEARKLLDKYNGIGVYRNGFRIRPMGDADFDWLKLDSQRVQTPTRKIGSNQVIGYVQIQSESESGLEEKSARDGLKNNPAYERLVELAGKVVIELENRRYAFRMRNKKPELIDSKMTRLLSFDSLKEEVAATLKKSKVDEKTTEHILKRIEGEAETKRKVFEEVQSLIAVYQGQATVGKIVNVIVHEGRKSLGSLRSKAKQIVGWAGELGGSESQEAVGQIVGCSESIRVHVDVFSTLFKRIDPLATGRRGAPRKLSWHTMIEHGFDMFESRIRQLGVSYKVDCDRELAVFSWEQDMLAIFGNLIDNSLFWLEEKQVSDKYISVSVSGGADGLCIDYRDSGPGIERNHIESELIFQPDFSTKPGGTGLGLAIAGEAAHRNGLKLSAIYSDSGAYFRLESISGGDDA